MFLVDSASNFDNSPELSACIDVPISSSAYRKIVHHH